MPHNNLFICVSKIPVMICFIIQEFVLICAVRFTHSFLISLSFSLSFCYSSRLLKTDMELEVLRYTNRISSEAHKEVKRVWGVENHDTKVKRLVSSVFKSILKLLN